MGENSAIAWTNHTFNAWEGCEKVSAGCKNCYAEARNARFHPKDGGGASHWGGISTLRLMRSEDNWRQPLRWNREARATGVRARVFCSSLSDVFEARPDLVDPRARLFRLIEECDHLDWLLLTKRPENFDKLVPKAWRDKWPDHVWAGATAEDNEMLQERVPHLRVVPARVRFLSIEPMLEELDLDPPFCPDCETFNFFRAVTDDGTVFCAECESEACYGAILDPYADEQSGINWVIAGGESGARARLYDLTWARKLRDQCRSVDVPFFHKQIGACPIQTSENGDIVAVKPVDRAGADPSEWPADLRIRMFPGEQWPASPEAL